MSFVKSISGIIVVIFLLLVASQLDNYTPEAKHAKNKTNTVYTMIVKEIKTISTASNDGNTINHQVKIKHDHHYLSAKTPLTIQKGDLLRYEYVNEENNEIKIQSVEHIEK